jgi:sigma-B regulation protein RsbU (phosphoserine phosphatase)
VAVYAASVSAVFGDLIRDLIIYCSAAIGLVASMALLWFRFPNYVRGKQLERQTELARQVQMDLLPPADSDLEDLDFAAECVPAWQVGGDFYDAFSTDEGHTAIVLGDVSGKGLPASVVVGLLVGAVRASSWLAGKAEHEASTARLSELLRARTSFERFASLFWCYYEPETRLLRYVNAGHLPPMVIKHNGAGELEILRLEEGGPVLGVVAGAEYEQGQAAVDIGDLLVLYSDGVVEAMNAAEEQFSEERLLAIIRENSARPSAEIRDEILRRVHAFLGKTQPQDDLTLVVARIR